MLLGSSHLSDFPDSLESFGKAIGSDSPTDTLLAISYFFENKHARQWFSVAELRDGFIEARIPIPANLHDVASKATKQELLICDRKSRPFRYQLSHYGIERVENRLEAVGLLGRASEESKLLSEISESLYKSLMRIPDLDERGYIQEALTCLNHRTKAYRAAVLMGWAGTIYHLRRKVEEQGFDRFCQAYEGLSLGKPKHISNIDDLESCKDKDFLLVLERMGILDKAVRHQLENCLDLRNGCGHPTQITPKVHRVKAFFEDIIEYALSR